MKTVTMVIWLPDDVEAEYEDFVALEQAAQKIFWQKPERVWIGEGGSNPGVLSIDEPSATVIPAIKEFK